MASLNTIKNWFKTGLKPTQAQFWASWESFFHKDDKIPQSAIDGLDTSLSAKADAAGLAAVAVSGSYNDLVNPPELALVATSGSYNDLADKPDIGGDGDFTEEAVKASLEKETIVDSDEIAGLDSADGSKLARWKFSTVKANLLAYFNTQYLRLTTAQTVAGVKTFSSSPIVPAPTTDMQAATKKYVDDKKPLFTTQEITSGGNYNNLEVTADLLVFKNENAQAILNGVWGKKDFHILNLSTKYEVRVNHNSSSVIGNGLPIKLPTAGGSVGVKGTARVLFSTEGYGYFISDTWGSLYRPEFNGLVEEEIVTVNEHSNAGSRKIVELRTFRDAQSIAMSKIDLNTTYPDAVRGFEVVCKGINTVYLKVDNNTNSWVSSSNSDVL